MSEPESGPGWGTASPAAAGEPNGETPALADVWEAARRLAAVARRTPVLTHPLLDRALEARTFVKAEHLQLTSAFKFRGMYNRLAVLSPEERARGVLTVSSGNAGQGLAAAAALQGVPATVIMPASAPRTKLEAVQAWGARVIQREADSDELFRMAGELVDGEGLALAHPFDHPATVAGQGTIGLELCTDVAEIDTVLAPTSGGGMLSGVALVVKHLSPRTRVVGVQPEGSASVRRALDAGRPVAAPVDTVADALTARTCGDLTLALVARYVDDVVLVPDETIFRAVRVLWDTLRNPVETGGAAGVAALIEHPELRRGRVAVITSGGNIDIEQLAHIAAGGTVRAWRARAG
jgi:threonine dehydratase